MIPVQPSAGHSFCGRSWSVFFWSAMVAVPYTRRSADGIGWHHRPRARPVGSQRLCATKALSFRGEKALQAPEVNSGGLNRPRALPVGSQRRCATQTWSIPGAKAHVQRVPKKPMNLNDLGQKSLRQGDLRLGWLGFSATFRQFSGFRSIHHTSRTQPKKGAEVYVSIPINTQSSPELPFENGNP